MTTTKIRPFLVLAVALMEGRLSSQEFVEVCLPLYKYCAERFPSEEHYQLATELFYAADDFVPAGGYREASDLDDEELKDKVAGLVERMRELGGY